ncbi:MAG: phosphoglycerate dehydrogenase [Elusimicrobia bacterium]|nr:phosphoglycerate dehydrogenase [Elusimicrobiota bacterium]
MRKVLIAPSSFGQADREPVAILERAGFKVIPNPYGRKLTKDELGALLPGVIGIISGLEPLTRDILERSELKVISRCGVGLSNVDLDAAQDLGIRVCYTPDAPTKAVAELTMGAMFALLRRLMLMNQALHEGRWVKEMGWQLEGKTVLIIGFGRIGREVARLLAPFGVKLLAADPFCSGIVDGVAVMNLDEALPHADIISFHASGDGELLGVKELALIKPGVIILNAARGGLINESALCEALDQGRVSGAWLDTFLQEPYQGPLLRYPQALLTPHAGSYTFECRRRMEKEASDNLVAALT